MKNGYVLEIWFKLDHIIYFCDNSDEDRFLIWAYPHAIYQEKKTDKVYFINFSNPKNKNELKIEQYEWNIIIIKHINDTVLVYLNMKFSEPVIEYTSQTYIKMIGFCSGIKNCDNIIRYVPSSFPTFTWRAAFYKKIKIYLINSINDETIFSYITTRLSTPIEGLIIHYLFNNDNTDFNSLKNVVDNKYNIDIINCLSSLPFSPFLSKYAHQDKFLLYTSSSNFDWGFKNKGFYVSNIDKKSGLVTYHHCPLQCSRCYSNTLCYECKEGYKLYNQQCTQKENYYFITPNLSKELVISQKFYSNPITISLWIKFHDIFYNKNPDIGLINAKCYLLIKLNKLSQPPPVSISNTAYFCIDKIKNEFLFKTSKNIELYKDVLFKNMRRNNWIHIGVSNYYSTDSAFPSMLNLSYDSKLKYFDSSSNIEINEISFGTSVLFQVSNILIYSSYIRNPYGIITNKSSLEKSLLITIPLIGGSAKTCVPSDTFDSISLNDHCIDDENDVLEDSLKCISSNQFYDGAQCQKCISDCSSCSDNTINECSCFNNDDYYLIPNIPCLKIKGRDFGPYSNVVFNNIPITHNEKEYTINLWLKINTYNTIGTLPNIQEIIWSDHIKFAISIENSKLKITYILIHNDNDVIANDNSLQYSKWNHLICSVSLMKNKYRCINNDHTIVDSTMKLFLFNQLIFKSELNNRNPIILIRYVRLFSIFSLLDYECKYNKKAFGSELLTYYELDGDKFVDSENNEARPIIKKINYDGYNMIINYQIADFTKTLPNCITLIVIPSNGFINKTKFLIYAILSPSDTFKYYYSTDLVQNNQFIGIPNKPEILYSFQEISKSIYISVSINGDTNEEKGMIKIGLFPTNEFSTRELDYAIETQDLNDKTVLSQNEISNRIKVIDSLIYVPNFRNLITITESKIISSKIQITNPQCPNDYCSNHGICEIKVRSLSCKCDSNHLGIYCHVLIKNYDYVHDKYLKYWDIITNNKDYSKMITTINQDEIDTILMMIERSKTFFSANSILYQEFLKFITIIYDTLIDKNYINHDSITMIIDDLLIKHYSDITNQHLGRLLSQSSNNNEQVALLLEQKIAFLVSKYIKQTPVDLDKSYTAFTIKITKVNRDFDYINYFTVNQNQYLPYFDASDCLKDYIGPTIPTPFFVMIMYKMNLYGYDENYLRSSSHLVDIFFTETDGTRIDINQCLKPISLYLPVNIFNTTLVNFIQENPDKINQPDNETKQLSTDPYFSSYVFVYPTGEVCNKTLKERVNERYLNLSVDCLYWDSIQKKYVLQNKAKITSSFYFKCEVNHLSKFMTSFVIKEITDVISSDGPFFYLSYLQIYKYSPNYLSFPLISLSILLIIFLLLIFIAKYTYRKSIDNRKSQFVNSVKKEILMQQRIIYSKKDILDKLYEISSKQIDQIKKKTKIEEYETYKGLPIEKYEKRIEGSDIDSKTPNIVKPQSQCQPINMNKMVKYLNEPTINTRHQKLAIIDDSHLNNNPIDNHQTIKIGLYDDIIKQSPSFCQFFCHMTLKHNFYLTPFFFNTLFIVITKRLIILFLFIFILFFSNTITLSLVDRFTNEYQKIFGYSLLALISTRIIIIPFNFMLRLSPIDKKQLENLLTNDKTLILEWNSIHNDNRGWLITACLFIPVFFGLSFYFSFTCITILYWNKFVFPMMITFNIIIDFFLECISNLIVTIVFMNLKKGKIKETVFQALYEWRNFHCCT